MLLGLPPDVTDMLVGLVPPTPLVVLPLLLPVLMPLVAKTCPGIVVAVDALLLSVVVLPLLPPVLLPMLVCTPPICAVRLVIVFLSTMCTLNVWFYACVVNGWSDSQCPAGFSDKVTRRLFFTYFVCIFRTY